MAMGTRKRRQRQEQLWVTHTELVTGPGHPFYKRLSQLLDGEKFDEFCEQECAKFYADSNGRPSLTPGTYFFNYVVPSVPERSGDFSDILPRTILDPLTRQPFPGNIIPANSHDAAPVDGDTRSA